jgi:hypothetical protein
LFILASLNGCSDSLRKFEQAAHWILVQQTLEQLIVRQVVHLYLLSGNSLPVFVTALAWRIKGAWPEQQKAAQRQPIGIDILFNFRYERPRREGVRGGVSIDPSPLERTCVPVMIFATEGQNFLPKVQKIEPDLSKNERPGSMTCATP